MADNLTAKYADLDTNSIGPIRFVDIGGVFYAVSILAQSDGTLLSTFPVSAASLPLPSGASTAAKQPALGTAGTASADVITVQGIASMTALKVDGSAVTQPVSGTFWQATQPVSVASVPSHDVTNAGTFAVQAAQSGTWNVTNVSGTVSLPTGASTLAEQQSQTTALQLIDDSVVAVDAVGTSAKVLMQGAIRDDALSALTPVEGDAVNLRTDANGALWVIPSGTTTISGTVDLGATDNAVLDAIAASLAGTLTVGSHAVTNAGTFATQATLQAGTAYAGKVRLTDGTTDTDIRDLTNSNALNVAIVDGSGDQITSFGGGTEYTEDAAAAANPVGKATILVRADTPGAVATTDGDNVAQRGTNYGAAYVQVVDSSGNFIDSFGGAGGTSSADDADFTAGTTLGTIVQGVYESTPTSVTDGDVGALGITNDRRLKTSAVVTSMPTTTVQATNLDIRDLTNADVVTAELSATDNAVLDAIAASVAGTLTVGSHAVTNAGTFAVQVDGAALTALQKIDDPVIVDDAAFTPATSSVNVAGFVFDDTTPDSVDEGDAGAARMSANRCQYMQIRDGSASNSEQGANVTSDNELLVTNHSVHGDNTALVEVTAIGASRDSDGNVRALRCNTNRDLKVTVEALATNIAKAEDAAHTTGDTGVFMLGVRSDTAASTAGTDGDYSALILDSSGRLHVNVGNTVTVGSHAVTNAGTFVVQVDGTALTRLTDIETNTDSGAVVGNGAAATAQRVTIANDSTGILAGVTTVTTVTTCSTVTTLTGGGVAHDGADSGNPIKIGARAAATLSDDTMVANADRTDAVSDLDGALIVRNQFPLADLLSERVSNTDGASTAFSTFGATASTRSYVTALSIYNASATAGYVDFRDGTAGSVLYTVPIPAGAGVVLSGGGLPLFRTTANTALAYDVSAALTTVYISISGFKSKASG